MMAVSFVSDIHFANRKSRPKVVHATIVIYVCPTPRNFHLMVAIAS